jgi:hypothetical protein
MAFAGCIGLTSITIPSNVINIEDGAFSRSGIVSVSFQEPSNVRTISSGSFQDCTRLTSINIPNSVTSIGNNAFRNCSSLTSITIPNSVMSIGNESFAQSGLLSITIPNSVTSIAVTAFRNCPDLTSLDVIEGNSMFRSEGNCLIRIPTNEVVLGIRTSVIPYGVTSIGDSAFRLISGLSSITIPNSVTSIGGSAFSDSRDLISVTFQHPSKVTRIENWTFGYTTYLSSIEIPNSVTSIGNNAFHSSGVSSVIFQEPSVVRSIGSMAFYQCYRLVNILIPNSVTSIEHRAFEECRVLTKIFLPISVTSISSSVFRLTPELTIYAEATHQPSGWNLNWNPDWRPVVWGHVSEDDEVLDVVMTGLLGNYPNPFNPSTTISFSVETPLMTSVLINIYNIRGQRIRTLMNEYKSQGEHSVVWNGRDDNGVQVSSGTYFYKMTAGEYQVVRRMMLMK